MGSGSDRQTAYSLHEMLTVKSDDIQGRNRMYESIVKGECRLEPGICREFQSIGAKNFALWHSTSHCLTRQNC